MNKEEGSQQGNASLFHQRITLKYFLDVKQWAFDVLNSKTAFIFPLSIKFLLIKRSDECEFALILIIVTGNYVFRLDVLSDS